jgi:hypothetical protein
MARRRSEPKTFDSGLVSLAMRGGRTSLVGSRGGHRPGGWWVWVLAALALGGAAAVLW